VWPQAAFTASGNFAGCAVDRTTIGIEGSRGSFSATASATAVCGSAQYDASRIQARMVAALSCSSARPAANSSRIDSSACAETEKRFDCAREFISPRTAPASRL
jgi:hypothetical protein